MSKFNTLEAKNVQRPGNTINRAGGEAFKQSSKLELISILLTSMVKDQYYRSEADGLNKLRELLNEVDPKFAAKAAIYARNEFGMRSITHVLAGEVAGRVKGEAWTKHFYDKVTRRADDPTEILAYYLSQYGKPVPNSLKKGLGLALGKFDSYQLAKYRGEGKGISLVDLVNLVHPKPTDKNREALKGLVEGTLRSEGTWETKISAAGKSENKETAKTLAWSELLKTKKIGYFALLRNLRNITEQAPELVDLACELLVDEKSVRKSLILPFQFTTALEQVEDRRVIQAVSKAIDISLGNVPVFPGKTLVVIDHSGSMGGGHVYYNQLNNGVNWKSLQSIGDLFGAAMYRANNADVMVFGTNAGVITGINPSDSVTTIARQIYNVPPPGGHGTNFRAIFQVLGREHYDRVVIFSDMQGWIGYNHPGAAFADWKRRSHSDPNIYSFDLSGYGDMQFPENKAYCLAGFSDKTFDVMRLLEQDRNALVNKIEAIEL